MNTQTISTKEQRKDRSISAAPLNGKGPSGDHKWQPAEFNRVIEDFQQRVEA